MDLPHGNACSLQAYPAQTAEDVNLDPSDPEAVARLRELATSLPLRFRAQSFDHSGRHLLAADWILTFVVIIKTQQLFPYDNR